MAARPHHAGSPYGKEVAEFIAGQFKSWGYDTAIAEYHVLLPTPVVRRVELVAPTKFTASLDEPALKEDATSGQSAEQLPAYNAYSIDGDVTGELVYVNYGVPADYEELDRHGIDVRGKIVLARYGGSWRGIKPRVAAERGAVGCLIYSDPRDDGYFVRARPIPRAGGAATAAHSADRSRTSRLYPGDPLTPGVAATKDARRPPFTEAKTLTKIPVLPISYADATPLLKALAGPIAPAAWRGALPLPYRLGPGPARVHLQLEVRLEAGPCLQRHRDAAWIGAPRRMDRPREPPRCVGERRERSGERHGRGHGGGAGDRRAGEGGLQAAPHAGLRGLGRRRTGPAGIDGVGGRQGRRALGPRCRLHQLGQQCPGTARRGRFAQPGASRQRDRARRRRSEDQDDGGRACDRVDDSHGHAGRTQGGTRRSRVSD